MRETELTVNNRKITLYGISWANVPVIYLNTVQGEGEAVWNLCRHLKCPPFTLAVISDILWNHDMSPWPAPAVTKAGAPCTGGADAWLTLLVEEILPAVESALGGKPEYSAIAGYSLAGLFAVYAAFRTDAFARVVSASGSFWFPDFVDYVKTHEMRRIPDKMYFSLGDREAHTRNPYLSTVEERTGELYEYCGSLGIPATFVLNPGNHFREPDRRMAEGIRWILDDKDTK